MSSSPVYSRSNVLQYAREKYNRAIARVNVDVIPFFPMPVCGEETDEEVPFSSLFYTLVVCAMQFKFWWHTSEGQVKKSSSSDFTAVLQEYRPNAELTPASFRRIPFRKLGKEGRLPWRGEDLDYFVYPLLSELGRITPQDLLNLKSQAISTPNSPVLLVNALATLLPRCYGTDPLFKKAQLAAYWIMHRLNGKAPCRDFTSLADYRLPQILRHYGILSYGLPIDGSIAHNYVTSFELSECIRTATILAMEHLASYFHTTPIEADMLLFGNRYELLPPGQHDRGFHLHSTNWY